MYKYMDLSREKAHKLLSDFPRVVRSYCWAYVWKTQASLLQFHPWNRTYRLAYTGGNKLFCPLFSACVWRAVRCKAVFMQRKGLQETCTYFQFQIITTINLFSRWKSFLSVKVQHRLACGMLPKHLTKEAKERVLAKHLPLGWGFRSIT